MESRELTREFMSEFLAMYRSYPCLWKVKSKEYSNRYLKEKAYAVLAEKWSEVDPNANKEIVVKKINSFRGSFRKELRRVEKSRKSDAQNPYKSKLWYFDKLTFLLDKEVPSEVTTELTQKEISSSDQPEPEAEFFYKEEISQDSYYSDNEELAELNGTETPRSTSSTTNLLKKRQGENYEHLLNKVSVKLDKPETVDEFAIVGINIANKLRKLPTETAIVVEKLLTDVLFEAQLGNINRYTRMHLIDSMDTSAPSARVIVSRDLLL